MRAAFFVSGKLLLLDGNTVDNRRGIRYLSFRPFQISSAFRSYIGSSNSASPKGEWL